MKNRLHLIAPAGSCRPFFAALGSALDSADSDMLAQLGPCRKAKGDALSPAEFIDLVQDLVGASYRVTGSEETLGVEEDELAGGRSDDRQRAVDVQQALADDHVVAIVALRGGAWFTRILPLIDLSVLDKRSQPIAVFGFSELTTLVNIVGAHVKGRGIYDMGPAFLMYGLKRHAETAMSLPANASLNPSSEAWATQQLLQQLMAYFRDCTSMIEGRGTSRNIRTQVVGTLDGLELPERFEATFVGGNLCVLTTLIGSRYHRFVEPTGRWLVLEDLNEKPERIDRFLAHLTLAGFWNRCRGILLGDFHRRQQQLAPAVAAMLPYHLPANRRIPILMTEQVGHVWPMSPLPLQVPLELTRTDEDSYTIRWPAGYPLTQVNNAWQKESWPFFWPG